MNITGGTFEQKNSDYLIGWNGSSKPTTNNGVGSDQDETKVVISGGTFINFNPENVKFFDTANGSAESQIDGCANGYVAESLGNGNYGVVPFEAAEVNGKVYNSIQAAINAAENGDTIKVLNNIDLAKTDIETLDGSFGTYGVVEGKSVTIDLDGKTISGKYAGKNWLVGVFSTDNNGHLTLTGNGTVDVATAEGSTVYSLIANYEPGCSITIENGTYKLDKASDSLIYSGSNHDSNTNEGIEVKDGTFTLGNVGAGQNGKPWIFNVLGANERHVWVTGGTYNADVSNQFWVFEVQMPETHYAKNNGDDTWTVEDSAAAYIPVMVEGYTNYVKYGTIEEALSAAKSGDTVCLLKDVTAANGMTMIPTGITLDLNGKAFTSNYFVSFGDIIDGEVGGNGKIISDTSKTIVAENNSFIPLYDTRDSSYKFYSYTIVKRVRPAEGIATDVIELQIQMKFNNTSAYDVLENSTDAGFDLVLDINNEGLFAPIKYNFGKELVKAYGAEGDDAFFEFFLSGVQKLTEGTKVTIGRSFVTEAGTVVDLGTISRTVKY